jgi:predicted porin
MGGRARVGAAIDRHKDFTTIGASDGGLAVKGGWNFGVVDVGLAWERMTYKCGGLQVGAGSVPAAGGAAATGAQQSGCLGATGDVKASQIGAALAVPVGPGTIRASYARAKDLDGGGYPGTDTGAKEWNVGYEHRFSKRTNVGVGYAKIDNKPAAAFTWSGSPPAGTGASNTPAAGVDVTTFFVSMTHRF